MATLTIRNMDAAVKARLRVRAARHGRSMEAEARTILSDAVAAEPDEFEPRRRGQGGGSFRRAPMWPGCSTRRRALREPYRGLSRLPIGCRAAFCCLAGLWCITL